MERAGARRPATLDTNEADGRMRGLIWLMQPSLVGPLHTTFHLFQLALLRPIPYTSTPWLRKLSGSPQGNIKHSSLITFIFKLICWARFYIVIFLVFIIYLAYCNERRVARIHRALCAALILIYFH